VSAPAPTLDADAGNLLTADEQLTIKSGSGTTQDIFLKAPVAGTVNGDSAKSTADKVNAAALTTGVTAQAKTVATIANISDGAVNFQLRGSNSIANDSSSKAVTITAKVVGGDLSALAQAVNAQSATTNVTASIKVNATGTTRNAAERCSSGARHPVVDPHQLDVALDDTGSDRSAAPTSLAQHRRTG
jgi:flagellin